MIKNLKKIIYYKHFGIIISVSIFLIISLITGFSIYHPDENLNTGSAFRVLLDYGNPGWFIYPAGILFYVNAFLYGLIFIVLKLFSSISVEAFGEFFYQGYIQLGTFSIYIHTPARIINLLIGALGVFYTYKLSFYLLKSKNWAMISSLVLAVSPLWISNSKFFTVDIPLGTMAIIIVYYTLVYFEEKKFSSFKYITIWSLIFAVFMSMKYYSIIQAFSIFAIFIYYNLMYHKSEKFLKRIFLGFALSSLFYLLTNPFLILDYKSAIEHIYQQFGHAGQGHFGFETENGWFFHIFQSFPRGFGAIPFILSILGSIVIFFIKDIKLYVKVFIVTATWPLFLFLAKTPLAFDRYMLAIYPLTSLLAIVAIFFFFKKIGRKEIKIALLVVLFAQQMFINFHKFRVEQSKDTRVVLTKLLSDIYPQNTQVYAGLYTREILFRDGIFNRIDVSIKNDLSKDSNEILIFDSFSHDRLIFSTFRSWALNIEAPHGREGLLEPELSYPLFNGDSLFVVRITPYKVPKEEVKYSPNSVYDSYMPDLLKREAPGPFIEIYVKDKNVFEEIKNRVKTKKLNAQFIFFDDSYYIPGFNKVLLNHISQIK